MAGLLKYARGLSQERLSAMLPHGQTMLMLDKVDFIDEQRIVCLTTKHRDPRNPLLLQPGGESVAELPDKEQDESSLTVLFVEFAAQAMALHELVLASYDAGMEISAKETGLRYVAQVQDLIFSELSYHQLQALPTVELKALLEFTGASGSVYLFDVTVENHKLCSGKLSLVVLNSK